MVERINKLIRETQREPFAGVGKPEPLKYALSGFWSRRITDEHRVVYSVEEDAFQPKRFRATLICATHFNGTRIKVPARYECLGAPTAARLHAASGKSKRDRA